MNADSETTIVRTSGAPVVVQDTSNTWTIGFLVLTAIALIVGAVAMVSSNNASSLRQQAVEMQQTSIQQQQALTQQKLDMTAAQQAALQARQDLNSQISLPAPAPTNVEVTDGINGGAGPGSKSEPAPGFDPTVTGGPSAIGAPLAPVRTVVPAVPSEPLPPAPAQ